MRVVTFVGTRPEVIRLSEVIKALDRVVDHHLVHTGQNYDFELNELIFRDLSLRPPDTVMEPDLSSLGSTIGSIISGSEKVLRAVQPDAVLVLGDTNSCLAGLMARRLHIPLFHMEAGNRCFDQNVPEETNRKVIDHIADINLVYTEHARRNLLAEGIHARNIYVTGSPLTEVLNEHRKAIESSRVLEELGLAEHGYIVASTHREENVDSPARLDKVIASLTALSEAFDLPVVLSAHPRLTKRLGDFGTEIGERVKIHRPFGFWDYNKLQVEALCTVSDSGSVSEEAAILGFPAVTIRDAIERPEAMDTGSILVAGIEPDSVVRCAAEAVKRFQSCGPAQIPVDYTVTDTSQRVVNLILGVSGLVGQWAGVRSVRGL
jgi:UDP-N-acetyl-L-fucosamine synthase